MHALRENFRVGRFSNSQITTVHTKHKAHTQHATTACQVPTTSLLCPVVTAFNSAGPSRAKMLLEAPIQSGTYTVCFKSRHLKIYTHTSIIPITAITTLLPSQAISFWGPMRSVRSSEDRCRFRSRYRSVIMVRPMLRLGW